MKGKDLDRIARAMSDDEVRVNTVRGICQQEAEQGHFGAVFSVFEYLLIDIYQAFDHDTDVAIERVGMHYVVRWSDPTKHQ